MSTPIVLSVSELTYAIKSHLEPMFRRIWVRGEASNVHAQASGHLYFSLVEGGAQLAAVLFKAHAAALQQPLKNGDTVIAEGELSIYPPRGSYQLIVRHLSHVGLGEALIKLQALKKKLLDLGWFRQERKKGLPPNIRTIGVVTSPSGAVIHDIINILTRRLGTFHLIINPVRVQGEGAAQTIARAIREFNLFSLVDVIIVCRGGGSAEDLAAFNEEVVAAACVESTIPIVSAIGHETDLSITDLVADIRAPTPSAAAELVSRERSEQQGRLLLLEKASLRSIQNRLSEFRKSVEREAKRLHQAGPQRLVEHHALRIDDIENALTQALYRQISSRRSTVATISSAIRRSAPSSRLAEQRTRLLQQDRECVNSLKRLVKLRQQSLNQLTQQIDGRVTQKVFILHQKYSAVNPHQALRTSLSNRLLRLRQQLAAIESNLSALSPKKTLDRGYAIIFQENTKQVVRSVHSVRPGEALTVMVADGLFFARATPAP